MKELIKVNQEVIGDETVNSVNARDIHEFLQVKTAFSHWINRAISKYDFKPNIDFVKIDKPHENNIKEYFVTIDMAKELAMLENNPKGKEVRKYFIQVEKAYKEQSIDWRKKYNIPENYSQALMLASSLALTVEEQKKTLKEQEPKVLFADSVAQSSNSILIGQFAKAICTEDFKIGQNTLFEWLRKNKYLISQGRLYNQPMQEYINKGYFEVSERTINNPDGSVRITVTTKITGKGQVALTSKIREAFTNANKDK